MKEKRVCGLMVVMVVMVVVFVSLWFLTPKNSWFAPKRLTDKILPQKLYVGAVHGTSRAGGGEAKSPILIPRDLQEQLALTRGRSHEKASSVNIREAVFVTATDHSHFAESRDSIASVQTHLPNSTVIYYDLGLTSSEVHEMNRWCRVVYRKLNFKKYPKHVKELYTYAFKPIIIQEVLQDYDMVIWFDASFRMKCSNFLNQLEPTIKQSGITTIERAGHSSYATTHQGMYDFLSVNQTLLKLRVMMGANFIALFNNKPLFDHVISWWVRCSLWRGCIAPQGSNRFCKFSSDRYKEYAHCHRYDQSALNLLLVDFFKGDLHKYSSKVCGTIERSVTHYFKVRVCKNKA